MLFYWELKIAYIDLLDDSIVDIIIIKVNQMDLVAISCYDVLCVQVKKNFRVLALDEIDGVISFLKIIDAHQFFSTLVCCCRMKVQNYHIILRLDHLFDD